jgi:putative transposase
LTLLEAYAERFGLDIWAYCLMPNHVHLIVRPQRSHAMALAIGNAHRAYSRLVNEQNGWTGHLWAGRYFSMLLDEEHLWAAVRYVELNPVRANLALLATDFPWSSARAHASLEVDDLLAAGGPFPGAIRDWSEWLQQGLDAAILERLRSNTTTGRPSVGPQLLEQLERSSDRALHPGRRGRHVAGIVRARG